MAGTTQSPLLASLERDGYAIVPNSLSQDQISTLRSAARRTAALARSGKWLHLRTVPKQFPPWPDKPGDQGIWGVQHLLHPDLADSAIFAEIYFGDVVISGVKEALGLGGPTRSAGHDDGDDGEGVLVMELFNMLVGPPQDFELRWHRDDVSFSLCVNEEERAMGLVPEHVGDNENVIGVNGQSERANGAALMKKKRQSFHAQYNIPLYPDDSLHVVPGSHRRGRTQDEQRLLAEDAHAPTLPGMIKVKMQPGDIVFYDNDIIHRGVYRAGVERLTLHGSVGDVRGGHARARNVLQHGVGEWVEKCDFGSLRGIGTMQRAESMRRRLVELGSKSGRVGFSHND